MNAILRFFRNESGPEPIAVAHEQGHLIGRTPTPEAQNNRLYLSMQLDYRFRATVLEVRRMDRADARVKRIHGRTARAATKGGLVLRLPTESARIRRAWERYERRLGLDKPAKLESDMRGLMMEGNLPMQWVLDADQALVIAGVRMPTETIRPNVAVNGQFKDVNAAYTQVDVLNGNDLVSFPLWQLTLGRLTPDNLDDLGSLGRPYLDATRKVWRQLNMTEEDLVIRRRTRAAKQLGHFLEGASEEELATYMQRVEAGHKGANLTDFYHNGKGAVLAIEGDANLDQIADVEHLLDTFFSGAPAPKGLFGYVGDLNRDILEDLKRDFFDELDSMQDVLSAVYAEGFALDLLLAGINPESVRWSLQFKERRTETLNQAADRGLKLQALGASQTTVWETAGLDPTQELSRRGDEAESEDPYPDPMNIGGSRVSVTPGNEPKSESATSVSNG